MLSGNTASVRIERHRTAIARVALSRPVRLAVELGLLTLQTTFFDYGCGHGTDVKFLRQRGFACSGWDPFYFPQAEIIAADVVNLGYVINVIEDEAERRAALLNAWTLAKEALIVAARLLPVESGKDFVRYNDGLITSRNTFQKYYAPQELKAYIDAVLKVDAMPAEPGVYFVFRDEARARTFRR